MERNTCSTMPTSLGNVNDLKSPSKVHSLYSEQVETDLGAFCLALSPLCVCVQEVELLSYFN